MLVGMELSTDRALATPKMALQATQYIPKSRSDYALPAHLTSLGLAPLLLFLTPRVLVIDHRLLDGEHPSLFFHQGHAALQKALDGRRHGDGFLSAFY